MAYSTAQWSVTCRVPISIHRTIEECIVSRRDFYLALWVGHRLGISHALAILGVRLKTHPAKAVFPRTLLRDVLGERKAPPLLSRGGVFLAKLTTIQFGPLSHLLTSSTGIFTV